MDHPKETQAPYNPPGPPTAFDIWWQYQGQHLKGNRMDLALEAWTAAVEHITGIGDGGKTW